MQSQFSRYLSLLSGAAILFIAPAKAIPQRDQTILIQNQTGRSLHFGKITLNGKASEYSGPTKFIQNKDAKVELPLPSGYAPFIYTISIVLPDEYSGCDFSINGYFFNGYYKYSFSSMEMGMNTRCQVSAQKQKSPGTPPVIELTVRSDAQPQS